MQRRDFVKLAGLTGLSLFLPWGLSSQARADQAKWGGPYFLHMHAGGGWDPTIFCDGKITASGVTPAFENRLVLEATEVNGIPVPSAGPDGKFFLRDNREGSRPLEDPHHFFSTVGKDVLVFNGLDTQTNNHETGVQGLACGHNDVELPALAALYAGVVARQRDVPLAFLAHGGYNRTGDVVGASRFPGNKVPLLINPFHAGTDRPFVSDFASKRILEMREERLAALERQATLPRNKRTLSAMRDAMRGGGAVELLQSVIDAPAPTIEPFMDGIPPEARDYVASGDNPLFLELGKPLETILRCFQAGISASATYGQGGFDTHSDHDRNQQAELGRFVARLRYVILRAQQLGLSDKLYVLVTSDFGRTPRYNSGNGRDHWNVTSALLVGPGIRGGRAIGKTDEAFKAMRVAPNDVTRLLPDSDRSGARIHSSHLHRELRRVLGVDKAEFINQFPLPMTHGALPLLG